MLAILSKATCGCRAYRTFTRGVCQMFISLALCLSGIAHELVFLYGLERERVGKQLHAADCVQRPAGSFSPTFLPRKYDDVSIGASTNVAMFFWVPSPCLECCLFPPTVYAKHRVRGERLALTRLHSSYLQGLSCFRRKCSATQNTLPAPKLGRPRPQSVPPAVAVTTDRLLVMPPVLCHPGGIKYQIPTTANVLAAENYTYIHT